MPTIALADLLLRRSEEDFAVACHCGSPDCRRYVFAYIHTQQQQQEVRCRGPAISCLRVGWLLAAAPSLVGAT
jgi:hypothetical protein